MGMEFLVAEPYRLPQLKTIEIPSGVDDLAGKVWRIGLMGYGSSAANVNKRLAALGEVL